MNNQPIEKRQVPGLDTPADGALDVHSVFRTIQGEGPFTGFPALFIRLAGCNLQCPKCDTDYTSTRERIPVDMLVRAAQTWSQGSGLRLVVITGGEPFRQDIFPLCEALLKAGFFVQIETNGTLAPPNIAFLELCAKDTTRRDAVFVVCSPKTGKVNPVIGAIACAFKYVATCGDTMDDGLPSRALDHTAHPFLARPPEAYKGPIYLQPCDDKDDRQNRLNVDECVVNVIQHGFVLQLQTHKYIGME